MYSFIISVDEVGHRKRSQPFANLFPPGPRNLVRVETYQLTIASCVVYLVVAAAFAQTLSSGSKLSDNPVYQEKCAKRHGKSAEGRPFGGQYASPKKPRPLR